MARLLVVTAVAAERDAVRRDDLDVIVGGVGPAEAAAATARALATGSYDRVLSAGIGGGFPGVAVGSVVVADMIVFADLGAETDDGFTPLDELGFGRTRYDVDPAVYLGLSAPRGTILTVSTVTGGTATADRLLARYPRAVAEAMEGAGVAAACALAGVAYGEVRAISNPVGPRDRAAWRIPAALTALAVAFAGIGVE
jgi:futalosine hydrolase